MKAIPVFRTLPALLAAGALLLGCEAQHPIAAPDDLQPQFAPGGNDGGAKGGSMSIPPYLVTLVDPGGWAPDAPVLLSDPTCAATIMGGEFSAKFRQTDCVLVYPCVKNGPDCEPSTQIFEGNEILVRNGNGQDIWRIYEINISIRDASSREPYYSGWIAMPPLPVDGSPDGFTIDLRWDMVPLWDTEKVGGKFVAVGDPVFVAIGQMVYTPESQ